MDLYSATLIPKFDKRNGDTSGNCQTCRNQARNGICEKTELS